MILDSACDKCPPTPQPSAAWTLEEMVARDYDPWADGSQDAQAKLYKAIARAVAQRCAKLCRANADAVRKIADETHPVDTYRTGRLLGQISGHVADEAAILAWQKEGK